MTHTIRFENLSMADVELVGGKNASLGEMIQHLSSLGVAVPTGFAVTTTAYKQFLQVNKLDNKIYKLLETLNPTNLKSLKKISKTIKNWIMKAEIPATITTEILQSLNDMYSAGYTSFAIRSSANAEDSPESSFAGQHDTFLNVTGTNNVLLAIKAVYASLFNERAIIYRIQNNFPHHKVALSAGIQAMVNSDVGSSGVMFTLDTETGFDKVIFINAAYGLGESVVQGSVNPDEFYLFKPALEQGKSAILQRTLGNKATKIIYSKKTKLSSTTKTVDVKLKERNVFSISDDDVTTLGKYALLIEKHYKKPMDIEWAKDGVSQKLYIVQARPETVRSRELHQVIDRFSLQATGEVIVSGHSIGQKIGQGKARIIDNHKNMSQMQPGEVLIADMTDPDWEPIMKMASAIVTNRGGRTCHAAIVARELGIPAIVGCNNATSKISQSAPITVSCADGEIGNVYNGLLPIKLEKITIADLPKPPVNLYLNLADPDQAFSYQSLPSDGVGLLRMEFIISNLIGIHPQALLKLTTLPQYLKDKISKKTAAYATPVEFYIEKLREGIATIAAAFHPKPVIVRFSDFKSNEYANLIGGKLFEPKEENPMIGFRGASRYLAENFVDCFALECEAIKRIRNDMNLTNLQIMLPFVRTVTEAENLIELLAKYGLKRGDNGLKIIMMCEIPSNALLATEFLKHFDGYSIGSNDLTQLTLGLDRDSSLVASLFDERNPAVKILLHQIITTCREKNKYIGICGQAPSDYPDLAKWLVQEGIQSLSLSADSLVETMLYLCKK